ncbi:hypothetical protein IMZ48_19545 [Candidatus Bathyarchaeota archaeon]|nr:hypothetical protein [Candidatus Bathyarchaeota archaeon]
MRRNRERILQPPAARTTAQKPGVVYSVDAWPTTFESREEMESVGWWGDVPLEERVKKQRGFSEEERRNADRLEREEYERATKAYRQKQTGNLKWQQENVSWGLRKKDSKEWAEKSWTIGWEELTTEEQRVATGKWTEKYEKNSPPPRLELSSALYATEVESAHKKTVAEAAAQKPKFIPGESYEEAMKRNRERAVQTTQATKDVMPKQVDVTVDPWLENARREAAAELAALRVDIAPQQKQPKKPTLLTGFRSRY